MTTGHCERRFTWRIWAYGFCIVFMGVFVNLTVRKVSKMCRL
jgi:hypothetical protein